MLFTLRRSLACCAIKKLIYSLVEEDFSQRLEKFLKMFKKSKTSIRQDLCEDVHPNEALVASNPENPLLDQYTKDFEKGRKESFFLKKNPPRPIPQFDESELEIGGVLGVGGFCAVREVKSINLSPSFSHLQPARKEGDENDKAFHESETRSYMAANVLREGASRYAIKRLKGKFSNKNHKYRGMLDLAIESDFLASLYHPNIVKMRGSLICDNRVSSTKFFIVLDRLYDTLQIRVDKIWPVQYKSLLGPFARIGKGKGKAVELYLERLVISYDLASVFRYLHGKRLVYRDIKPENIGFDVRGDVKLFDFGLCKELPESKNREAVFKLTARTGSIPYMAPEIMMGQKYNHKADVFSFGFLLWEIFALKIPLKGFDRRDIIEKVVKANYRPPDSGVKIPLTTKMIMKECWLTNPNDRPGFERIANVIRGEINDMADSNIGGSVTNRTEHLMNRSMNSMHQREDV